MDFDFSRLIAPLDARHFFSESWEKRPLRLARTDPGYYAELFSPEELEDLICFTHPHFAGEGPVLRGGAGEGSEDPGLARLGSRHAQGQTILIHGVQQRQRAVARLCRNLEATLRHPVNVNLYLTPPDSQGFGPHYDDHDVFIVQIHGSKRWRLYDPVRELPLKGDEATVPRERLGAPREEVLHAGDLLYLPRGHVHEAAAMSEASLHLTVGVEVLRWADLVASALACLGRDDPRLRRALPVGLLGGSEDHQEELTDLLGSLVRRARWDHAVGALGETFIRRLPAVPDGRFITSAEAGAIGLDTPLLRRTALCQVVDEGTSCSLIFPGNQVRGPAQIAGALRFVATAPDGFTARALPGNLSDGARLTLLRRLMVEGLLAPGSPARTARSDRDEACQPRT
jgi:hypothetical protein